MNKSFCIAFLCATTLLASCTNSAERPSFLDAKISDTSTTTSTTSNNFYLVTFKNGDVLLDAKKVSSGSKVTYTGTTPKKVDDTNSGIVYTFIGWSTDSEASYNQAIAPYNLPVVTKDTTYFAIFSSSQVTLKKYSVTFKTLTTVLSYKDDVTEGSQPINVYTGPITPSQDPVTSHDGQTTVYTFVGWSEDPTSSPENALTINDLPVITKDTIYFAIFSSALMSNTYTITFMNGDTILGNPVTVNKGVSPQYYGTEPERKPEVVSGVTRYYTFVGWHTNPNVDPKDAYGSLNIPAAVKDETYYAIYSYTTEFDFKIDKETIELDFGSSDRTNKERSNGITGSLSTSLSNQEYIYSNLTGDLESEYTVDWSIPEEDKNFFALSSSSGSYVKVTAHGSASRYSTLTARLINKNSKTVVSEKTCELRSVMVNTYAVYNQTFTDGKIYGCSVSEYADGYDAIFYPSVYGGGDVVVPSKLTLNGVTKKVVKFSLAFATGNNILAPIEDQNKLLFRHLYVPNTVCVMRENTISFLDSNGSLIFQSGGTNYTLIEKQALCYKNSKNEVFDKAAKKINLTDGTFPYNFYSLITSNSTTNPTFSSLTNISSLTDNNNSYPILLKKE